jgi:Tfp pilus assembly protein PilW
MAQEFPMANETGLASDCRKSRGRSERGVTLIETMMAALILIIVVVGLLPIFVLGFQMNEQQGDIATRTTEYAQDKIESLVNLQFADGATDTTQYPPVASGGTGLGGAMAASTTVGSIPPTAAVTGYVDYLDVNGNLLTSSTNAYYRRQWSIATDSTGNLKTITVDATSLQAAGIKGLAPSSELVYIKANGL